MTFVLFPTQAYSPGSLLSNVEAQMTKGVACSGRAERRARPTRAFEGAFVTYQICSAFGLRPVRRIALFPNSSLRV